MQMLKENYYLFTEYVEPNFTRSFYWSFFVGYNFRLLTYDLEVYSTREWTIFTIHIKTFSDHPRVLKMNIWSR